MHEHTPELEAEAAARHHVLERHGPEQHRPEWTDAARAAAAGDPRALSTQGVLGLQRLAGNAALEPLLDPGPGRALDPDTRTDMEARLGHDFGDVRLHTGAAADAAAASVQAQAYTVGTDIVFRQGAYDPGSPRGQHLLAHELTHVVQQRGGPVDGTDRGDGVRISDPGDRFEREAQAAADEAINQTSLD